MEFGKSNADLHQIQSRTDILGILGAAAVRAVLDVDVEDPFE
jgi:hypothetical protein